MIPPPPHPDEKIIYFVVQNNFLVGDVLLSHVYFVNRKKRGLDVQMHEIRAIDRLQSENVMGRKVRPRIDQNILG